MAATTETTADALTEASPATRLREALARLSNTQKVVLMVAVAAVISLLIGSIFLARQEEYKVLFSNLGERDGGSIIAALEQQNIPYRFNDGGSAILIPSTRVHETRLRLAAQGLPKGGSVGFELMENQKFGISQFAEQVNYQRGLEGELARTIQSIGAVEGARIHLAIPKPSVFVREEQKPTASVMLTLYPGRSLDPLQVTGIQNLVASSVPKMAISAVTIVDQSGSVLSQIKSKLMEAGLDPTQLTYVREIENNVIKRIEDIVLPITGEGNARVQVSADVDFSQSEFTAETHKPNAAPPDISIRSQQTSETASANTAVGGVPGALTNQPPVPATAPITQPATGTGAAGAVTLNPPGQINAAGVQAQISSVGQPLATRKDSTINYEVDRTVRHTRQSIGNIKRLSAAVVINHRKDVDKKGKALNKPFDEAEIKQISDLVKEAMGYSKERGDSISVVNAAFTSVEKVEVEIPLWKNPEILALARELIKWIVIAAIIAYLLLGVVRPILKTMFPEPEVKEDEPTQEELAAGAHGTAAYGAMAEDGEAMGEEDEESGPSPFEIKLAEVRELVDRDPQAAANIVKEWLGVNGG